MRYLEGRKQFGFKSLLALWARANQQIEEHLPSFKNYTEMLSLGKNQTSTKWNLLATHHCNNNHIVCKFWPNIINTFLGKGF